MNDGMISHGKKHASGIVTLDDNEDLHKSANENFTLDFLFSEEAESVLALVSKFRVYLEFFFLCRKLLFKVSLLLSWSKTDCVKSELQLSIVNNSGISE